MVRPPVKRNTHSPVHIRLRGFPLQTDEILRIRETRQKGLDRYVNLRQIGDHDIGTGLVKCLRMPASIDADDAAEFSRAARLDSGDCIFHHNRSGRLHAETPGSL